MFTIELFQPFVEPNHLLNTSNLPIISKLIPSPYFTKFELDWKIATLLALVTNKHCSHLTLLCIDNQHLFLQHNAATFVPASGCKTDKLSTFISNLD